MPLPLPITGVLDAPADQPANADMGDLVELPPGDEVAALASNSDASPEEASIPWKSAVEDAEHSVSNSTQAPEEASIPWKKNPMEDAEHSVSNSTDADHALEADTSGDHALEADTSGASSGQDSVLRGPEAAKEADHIVEANTSDASMQ